MGIDVTMEWEGRTVGEHAAQITGFATDMGHVGYLREAYHGEPYATFVLCPEGFDYGSPPERCPVHGEITDTCWEHDDGRPDSFSALLTYQWAVTKAETDGEPAPERPVGLPQLTDVEHHCACIKHGVHVDPKVIRQRTEAVIQAAIDRAAQVYDEPGRTPAHPVIKSYVDFIDLYLRLCDEGKSPTIYVSH